eukprot:100664-Chlamydomonas_euryale.AAC.5
MHNLVGVLSHRWCPAPHPAPPRPQKAVPASERDGLSAAQRRERDAKAMQGGCRAADAAEAPFKCPSPEAASRSVGWTTTVPNAAATPASIASGASSPCAR